MGQSHPVTNSTNRSMNLAIGNQCRKDTMRSPSMLLGGGWNRHSSRCLRRCAVILHVLLWSRARRTSATQRTPHCDVVCYIQQPPNMWIIKQQAANIGVRPEPGLVVGSDASSQRSVRGSNEDQMGQVKHIPTLIMVIWGMSQTESVL